MESISSSLLAVLEAQPSISASPYRQNILHNAERLDNICSSYHTASAMERVTAASHTFGILFKERAILPEMSSYKSEQQKNWSSTAWLPAACFVKAQNTQEVTLALKVIAIFQIPFAVRSGGHSANPGFGSIDSGILVYLSLMNDIVLSSNHKVVPVGPGVKSDVPYEELENYELTVAGGRAAGVGIRVLSINFLSLWLRFRLVSLATLT